MEREHGNGHKRDEDPCFAGDYFIAIPVAWDEALLKADYPGSLKDFVRAIARLTWGRYNYAEVSRVTDEDILKLLGLSDRSGLAAKRRLAVGVGLMEIERRRDPKTQQQQNFYRLLPPEHWIEYQRDSDRKFLQSVMEQAAEVAKKAAETVQQPPEHVDTSIHVVPRGDQYPQGHVDTSTQEPRGDQYPPSLERAEDNQKDSFERVSVEPVLTPKQRRRAALQAREASQKAEREVLLNSLPLADRNLIVRHVEVLGAGNVSGKRTLAREVIDIQEVVTLRGELEADFRDGLDRWRCAMADNAGRSPNIIAKAARSF